MIKIKDLQNVQDCESITIEHLTTLINGSDLQNNRKLIKLKSKNSKLKQSHDNDDPNDLASNDQLISYNNLIKNRRSSVDSKNSNSQILESSKNRKKYTEKGNHLKQIVTQQKIKLIVRNFIKKLRRNNINSTAIDFTPYHSDADLTILDKQGFQLHQSIFIVMSMLSIIQIVLLCFLYTIAIVFNEINQNSFMRSVQTFSLVFYLTEIFINFITVKFQQGKRLTTFRDIWTYYLKKTFFFDLISVLILIFDIFTEFEATIYLRLFILFKMTHVLQKMEKLQIFFINNFYNQQYWSLIKVLLFNYCFAHILAIFLLAMTGIDQNHNWMTQKMIYNSPWYQKYAWSYYWATTIMLTVGFGDFSATTYKQAIVLIFIQTISCMALAYNINCIGTLISNIRSQDLQKSKNFKIFKKLARKNNVTEDLQWRINNYIEQSSNIKKKFNHQEQNIFVEKLPKGLRTQFLKQSNKKIFQNLPFFRNLMQKTLFSFAQKIQMHICHPEQILQQIDDRHNLMILKGGKIGFSGKKSGCEFNSIVVDTLGVSERHQPALISLGFIHQYRSMFQIKSLEYSIIYYLDQQIVLSILKGSQMDYELYCLLRDKCSHVPDQFQLFKCDFCPGRHTKFNCPKLHYIPIRQHVTNKYLHKFKNGICERKDNFIRYQHKKICSLKLYPDLNTIQPKKSLILQEREKQKYNFGSPALKSHKILQKNSEGFSSFLKQIQSLKQFFSKNVSQILKNEINKIYNAEGYDQVWIIQTDKIKNYKNYFQPDNSSNLVHKFSMRNRNKQTIESGSAIASEYSELQTVNQKKMGSVFNSFINSKKNYEQLQFKNSINSYFQI